MIVAAILLLLLTSLPAGLYFRNAKLFRTPQAMPEDTPGVSVLIPARNEAANIRQCVESVLANVGVEIECIVLDDGSTDDTASIVKNMSDDRVRLETAPPLPEGWCGKQHACFVLSKHATKPYLCFIDADVTLHSLALARMIGFQRASGAALVSGFPRQITITFFEKLLIPLMHFILLCFLPISRMRTHKDPSLGAGCGQWFLTTREAYESVGGHEAVKSSFHDGVKLPRAYRAKGFMTDICDGTELASCRMYCGMEQVWNGLAKNAREGLGSPKGIWFWTIILFTTQILPWMMVVAMSLTMNLQLSTLYLLLMFAWAGLMPILVRLHAARQFQQSNASALLHPFGILGLLAIQWYATIRYWLGKPIGWKGRKPVSNALAG